MPTRRRGDGAVAALRGKLGRRRFLEGICAAFLAGSPLPFREIPRAGAAEEFKRLSHPPLATLLPFKVGRPDDRQFIREEIVCVRPVRIGGPRVEAEDIDGKAVVHCYGHGGSGWTLAPGTTAEAVEILRDRLTGEWAPHRGGDVTIIGAGIVGQMCAYNLLKLRERDGGAIGSITMVAERSEGITTDHAGGLFEPVIFGRNVLQKQTFLDSYRFYRDLSLGLNPDFPAFESELLPTFTVAAKAAVRQLIDIGDIPPVIPMKVRINQNVHTWMMMQLFFMNVIPFNRLLRQRLSQWGVPLQTGIRIERFSEIETHLVMDCTGYGARALCGDDNVIPVTGHLVTFQNQPRGLLDIANTQFVAADQIDEVRGAIERFGKVFSDIAKLDDATAQAVARALAVHEDIKHRLVSPDVETDPDWPDRQRVRLFETSTSRNRHVFDLSRIAAATSGSGARHATALAAYSSMINRSMKRYMFGIGQDYPTDMTCTDCPTSYSADSYAFPLLQGKLARAADGSFGYVGQDNRSTGVPVFVGGGTYIEGLDLPVSRNAEEFEKITDRLRFLGF